MQSSNLTGLCSHQRIQQRWTQQNVDGELVFWPNSNFAIVTLNRSCNLYLVVSVNQSQIGKHVLSLVKNIYAMYKPTMGPLWESDSVFEF